MSRYVIVVDRLADWRWSRQGLELMGVDDYLQKPLPRRKRPNRVLNLCRRHGYLTAGYYCSLLAEARSETPLPTVADILDLSKKSLYAYALPDLDALLQATFKRLAAPPEADFDLHVYFGRAEDPRFRRLAAAVFDLFRFPLLRLRINQGKRRWHVKGLYPLGLQRVPARLSGFFEESLRAYVRAPRRTRAGQKPPLYDLGILVDPAEALPPSDAVALERFQRAGKALRMAVEVIGPRDLTRVPEFDALFLRQTTALDNVTFRFARKAEQEGMPVIDDPASILRCTNKVFLAELLAANRVPTPTTLVVERRDFAETGIAALEARLGYPMVLKIPDGSFSRGVVKAENREQALSLAADLLQRSRLILAQEYMYTPYDWRIGLLGGQPLYACQYAMSRNHWQIYRHEDGGRTVGGGWKTFAVEDAPPEVVDVATRAAGLIGDGLYGVDVKQTDAGAFVIEVNDNPSLDGGVEDQVLKGDLYTRILQAFIRRIDAARGG